MKALSIIGIVVSAIGILMSIGIMNMKSYYDIGNYSYTHDEGMGPGVVCLILFLFFLAFSITATAVSFKKKN